jgi:hypothetical protein
MNKVFLIIVIIGFLCIPCGFATQGNEKNSDSTKILGSKAGQPIYNSILIINNQYIEPPYVTSRDGLRVLINGFTIWKWPKWPLPNYSKLPDIEVVKRKVKTYDEFRNKGYFKQVSMYYFKHYNNKKAVLKILTYFRSLPFIQKITSRVPGNLYCYKVIVESGKVVNVVFHPGTSDSYDSGQWTADMVIAKLEDNRRQYEEILHGRGAIIFLNSSHIIKMDEEESLAYMSGMLNVLESTMPLKKRLRLLEVMGISISERNIEDYPIIKGLKNSMALRKCLQERRLDRKISPVTIKMLEEAVKVEKQEERDVEIRSQQYQELRKRKTEQREKKKLERELREQQR